MLVSRWNGEHLALVDPYQAPTDSSEPFNIIAGREGRAVNLTRAYIDAKAHMLSVDPTGKRHAFILQRSPDAAQQFTDASLDFVYVDGAHEEAAVTRDLEGWWPKLRKGAIFAGHDYTGHFGRDVSLALRKFTKKIGRQFCVVDANVTGSWLLLK